MPTKTELLAMADQACGDYEFQTSLLVATNEEVAAAAEHIQEQLEQVLHQTAVTMIPKLDPAALPALETALEWHRPVALMAHYSAQHETWQHRLETILADERYQHREALVGPQGRFRLALDTSQTLVTQLKADIAPYEFDAFSWLYQRGFHKPSQTGAFGRFVRAVTLVSFRENRTLKAVQEQLPGDFAEHAASYEALSERLATAEAERLDHQARYDDVIGLVQEQAEIQESLAQFEPMALSGLRHALTRFLAETDLAELLNRVQHHLLFEALALQEKLRYLDELGQYLKAERADRVERIQKIRRVQRKWRHSKRRHFADKSRWLREVPHIKRRSIEKSVSMVRNIIVNLERYDRYRDFAVLYRAAAQANQPFIAYDAFSLGSVTQMPYEGFSRMVLTSLAVFRTQHAMERADRTSMKRWLRSYDHDNDWDDYCWDPSSEGDEDEDDFDEESGDDLAEAAVGAYIATEVFDELSAEAASSLVEETEFEALESDVS